MLDLFDFKETNSFEQNGVYNLTFYGFNHIQKLSDSVSKLVHVLDPVEGLTVTDMSNGTLEPEDKKFLVEIQNIGTNSCLLIDFGERIKVNGDYHTYGYEENCRELFRDVKPSTHQNILSNTMELEKRYSKPKDYYLKFTLANRLSKEVKKLTVTVIG